MPNRAELRIQLNQAFRTDSDFNAFCHDHFHDVFNRFADGMDRTQKVTLLLTLADLEKLGKILAEHMSKYGTSSPTTVPSAALVAENRNFVPAPLHGELSTSDNSTVNNGSVTSAREPQKVRKGAAVLISIIAIVLASTGIGLWSYQARSRQKCDKQAIQGALRAFENALRDHCKEQGILPTYDVALKQVWDFRMQIDYPTQALSPEWKRCMNAAMENVIMTCKLEKELDVTISVIRGPHREILLPSVGLRWD